MLNKYEHCALDTVLDTLGIDLKLDKWSVENVKESILKSKYEETHVVVFRCTDKQAKEINGLLEEIKNHGISITETIDLIKGE